MRSTEANVKTMPIMRICIGSEQANEGLYFSIGSNAKLLQHLRCEQPLIPPRSQSLPISTIVPVDLRNVQDVVQAGHDYESSERPSNV
jgi:hypothetical protein